MENAAPFEILGGPVSLYVAPVGTAFPDVDETPAGPWALIGTTGNTNYGEDGVTVEQSQTLNFWRGLGAKGPVKAFRSQEEQKIRLTLNDLSLEQYKLAMNGNAITAQAAGVGTPGTKTIGLSRGETVTQYALLMRGPSPYMEDGVAQFEVPVAVQSGNPQPVFVKEGPAALAIEFTTLEDPDATSADEKFGRLVAQTAVASA